MLWRRSQGSEESFAAGLAGVLAEVAPVLDERARRLLLGAGARRLGRGGIKLIAAATGASKDTVGRVRGVGSGVVADGRVRTTGRGASRSPDTTGVGPALRAGGPETRGDPTSPLLWTTKSTVNLADELAGRGIGRTGRSRGC